MSINSIPLLTLLFAGACLSADAAPKTPPAAWKVGTPIVSYWAGPAMSGATARQMAEGGFNVVWCGEKELDIVQGHGLRGQLQDGLIALSTLDQPEQREKLDALIERVRKHPALYSYFITDEPNATNFPALGKLARYLRERDPEHMAYINLFPTYATSYDFEADGNLEVFDTQSGLWARAKSRRLPYYLPGGNGVLLRTK